MKRYLMIFLAAFMAFHYMGASLPSQVDSHDIASLHAWGPYSKRYAGISHIPDMSKGIRFDFSVMPGYYRNRQLVPHVLFESSYYPWEINPEVNRITYRYELEWKDKVYTDVTYYVLDDNRTLVGIHCVNNTGMPQNLVLNQMAYIDYPETYPQVTATGASRLQWYNAIDYTENEPVRKSPQYRLVYDGWWRNEERTASSLDGSILGRGFGRSEGDRLSYQVKILPDQENGAIGIRFKVKKGENAVLQLKGLVEQSVTLKGTGEFSFVSVLYQNKKAGEYKLELISGSTVEIGLDGFFIGSADDISNVKVVRTPIPFTPAMEVGKNKKDFILKYKDCENYYGVAWNHQHSEVREILNGELESFFRRKVHDHVSSRLVGDRKWHYTNAFLRPVVLEPDSEQTIYMLVCTGDKEQVQQELQSFHSTPDKLIAQVKSTEGAKSKDKVLPGGEKYLLGNRLLQASLLSNIVYPVYTQKEYIRHFTPGKNWNSLYTWDSGFIALGLIDVDPAKAFECIKAYTTPVGSESAFIHHGTPLPIQMYAYADLWNNSLSRESLEFLYPRLKQFFNFMVGNDPYSTTRMKGSGLLRTWDYFYNSGGWDDYPPQQEVHRRRLQASCAPVVTTAHAIRCAKILAYTARLLGETADADAFDADALRLGRSLQTAWDEESGYFGYLLHDPSGDAADILRTEQGLNYDMGLDGASPLFAGACTELQKELLWQKLQSPEHLWCACGLSTVDQSAPYYRRDGYWNGAVWMPYQWMFFKSALDAGLADFAYRIADTALTLWQNECAESYCCFEHFMIESRRGAGWHQFSGLSSPIVQWFSAYYRPGTLTTGFDAFVRHTDWAPDNSALNATLDFTAAGRSTVLAVLQPGPKAVTASVPCTVVTRHDGLLELTFALDAPCTVTISIHS